MKKVKIISIILVTLLTFVSLSACANTPTLYKVEPLERIEGIEYGDKQPSRFAEDMTDRIIEEYKYESYILDWLLTAEPIHPIIIMEVVITDWIGEYDHIDDYNSQNGYNRQVSFFSAYVKDVFSNNKELIGQKVQIANETTSKYTRSGLPSFAIGNRFLIFAGQLEAESNFYGAIGSYFIKRQPSTLIDIVTCSDGKEYLIRWHSDFKSMNADKLMVTDQNTINMVIGEFADRVMLQAKQEQQIPYYIYPYEEIKNYMREVRND